MTGESSCHWLIVGAIPEAPNRSAATTPMPSTIRHGDRLRMRMPRGRAAMRPADVREYRLQANAFHRRTLLLSAARGCTEATAGPELTAYRYSRSG